MELEVRRVGYNLLEMVQVLVVVQPVVYSVVGIIPRTFVLPLVPTLDIMVRT